MTIALLFCSGTGKRWAPGWPDDMPKQLIDIEGERLLDRTVRQLTQRLVEPVVVSWDKRLEVDGAVRFDVGKTDYLSETMLMTKDLWDDRTVGLLGDVCFSDDAMNTICSSTGPRWFGRSEISLLTAGPAESFGFAFDADSRDRFANAMNIAIADGRLNKQKFIDGEGFKSMNTEPGGSWQVYRAVTGIPINEHLVDTKIWCEIDDWTDDHDTPARYNIWLDRYSRRWARDNG